MVYNQALDHDEAALDHNVGSAGLPGQGISTDYRRQLHSLIVRVCSLLNIIASPRTRKTGFKPFALRPAPSLDPRETMPSFPFPPPRGAPFGGGSEHKSDADLAHQGKRKEIGRSDKGVCLLFRCTTITPGGTRNRNGGPIHLNANKRHLLC